MVHSQKPDFSNLRIGISVSDSADLSRLGFSESHLRLALGEIARTILVHGGNIVYGGHLLAGGYTPFLVRELERYGNPDRPLHVYLPWSEHAVMDYASLEQRKSEYGLYATAVFLDIDGQIMERETGPALREELTNEERIRSLTGMRNFVTANCDCRILIGGKLRDYQGRIPGLFEEAILALRHGTPLLLVGGFGGATIEIIRTFNPELAAWLPEKSAAEWLHTPSVREALGELKGLWNQRGADHYRILGETQIAKLAATHRASEVATLIGQALNRLDSFRARS
jgi:hypothetical protein